MKKKARGRPPVPPGTVLGAMLRIWREDQGLTQAEAAARLHVTVARYGAMERRKVRLTEFELETITKQLGGGKVPSIQFQKASRNAYRVFRTTEERVWAIEKAVPDLTRRTMLDYQISWVASERLDLSPLEGLYPFIEGLIVQPPYVFCDRSLFTGL